MDGISISRQITLLLNYLNVPTLMDRQFVEISIINCLFPWPSTERRIRKGGRRTRYYAFLGTGTRRRLEKFKFENQLSSLRPPPPLHCDTPGTVGTR